MKLTILSVVGALIVIAIVAIVIAILKCFKKK